MTKLWEKLPLAVSRASPKRKLSLRSIKRTEIHSMLMMMMMMMMMMVMMMMMMRSRRMGMRMRRKMMMMMMLPEPVGGALFQGTAVRKISRVRHLGTVMICNNGNIML